MRKCCATQQRRSKWRRQLRQVSYPSYVTPISPLYHPIILLNFQNQDNYEVESILDSKVVSGKTVYLVQWKGYDEDGSDAQPTWEPAANLEGAREIVRDYEAKRRAAAERPAREGGGSGGANALARAAHPRARTCVRCSASRNPLRAKTSRTASSSSRYCALTGVFSRGSLKRCSLRSSTHVSSSIVSCASALASFEAALFRGKH